MTKKKIFIAILLLGCFYILPVYAATDNNVKYEGSYCIPNDANVVKDDGTTTNAKGYYDITIPSKATEVEFSNITLTDVVNRHVPYPDGITESEKVKYQFSSEFISASCYIDSNGKAQTCPSAKQLSTYDIYSKFNKDNYNNYVTFVLNESTGKFDVYIKDLYNDNLYVRYVSSSQALNTNGTNLASTYINEFLTRTTYTIDGNTNTGYKISNVSGSTDGGTVFLNLEFYIKNDSTCNGSYIGLVGIQIPSINDFEISNPAVSNPASYGCSAVLSYVPNGMTSEEQTKLDSLKRNLVSECYDSTITYNKKASLASTISTKFETLKGIFANYTGISSTETLYCNNGHTKNKLTYTDTGSYWSINCFETYTAQGDTAKLVSAGNGFEYQTNYSVTRTCSITQISKPTKAPKCQHDCGHVCYWNERSGGKSGSDGGPSEDFDACVNECDGGKYTQSCINSCYNKTYTKTRDLSFTEKFSYQNQESSNVVKTSSCVTNHGRNGETATGGCGETYCVSDWCSSNSSAYCVSWNNTYPAGCEENPDANYNSKISASQSELSRFQAKQTEAIDTGSYTYKITDSSLKTSDNKNYVFTVNSDNNPALVVESSDGGINYGSSTTTSLGNSGGASATYNPTVTKKINIKVSLPVAYLNKVTGKAVYTSKNSNKAFSIDNKNNRLTAENNFNTANYYEGGNKYYTDIWSENLNVGVDCNGKATLFRTGEYNIKVTSSNVGEGDFSSNIECYYGVYNNYYKDSNSDNKLYCVCENGTCPTIGPPNDYNIDDTGIQYIFRTIDLNDVIPNEKDEGGTRVARFNWTGTIDKSTNTSSGAALTVEKSLYSDAVDPERLIENIESKGETIYTNDSETDYVIILTKENIRNIRKYNKKVKDYNGDGENNYLDYNMSCYTNSSGRQICTSKFLDNIDGNSGSDSNSNFVTYGTGYTIDSRKSIAGCNNSKNGTECDTISK